MSCPPHLEWPFRAYSARVIAAHFHHELANGLGAISSSVFVLKRRLAKHPNVMEDAGVVRTLLMMDERVKTLTSRLNERRDPGRSPRDVLVVSDVINRLLSALYVPSGVLLVPPPPSRVETLGAEEDLQLSAFCLVQNAVEAVGQRGSVWVRVTSSGVQVDDDGPGIPPEVVDSATRPFVSTKSGRMGLGLPIARYLAEHHLGGRLELVASEQGARACLLLSQR